MSHINISNIIVNNNPAPFLSPFRFSVTFECLQPIKEEIEWKIVYVGSPKDENFDQQLDCFNIGPFTEPSIMQFEIEAPSPDWTKIPAEDMLGVAALIHTVSYQKQEFFRVGYFVYNNYEDPFLMENPFPLQVDKIGRSILADKPRIIRHNIDWESESSEKLKALNDILIENSNLINNNSDIQFRGVFSDVSSEHRQNTSEQNGFNWNNNNMQGSNNFGFAADKENMASQKPLGLFGEDQNNNQQQYGSNCFMNQANGGAFNTSQPGLFNQSNGNYLFGNGFFNGTNVVNMQ